MKCLPGASERRSTRKRMLQVSGQQDQSRTRSSKGVMR
jgi:hypothetical protein